MGSVHLIRDRITWSPPRIVLGCRGKAIYNSVGQRSIGKRTRPATHSDCQCHRVPRRHRRAWNAMKWHGWAKSSREHANRRRLPRTQSHLHIHSNPSGKRQSAGPSGRSRGSLPSTTVATLRLVHHRPALLHNVPSAAPPALLRGTPFSERGRFPHWSGLNISNEQTVDGDANASMAFKRTLSPSHVLLLLMACLWGIPLGESGGPRSPILVTQAFPTMADVSSH